MVKKNQNRLGTGFSFSTKSHQTDFFLQLLCRHHEKFHFSKPLTKNRFGEHLIILWGGVGVSSAIPCLQPPIWSGPLLLMAGGVFCCVPFLLATWILSHNSSLNVASSELKMEMLVLKLENVFSEVGYPPRCASTEHLCSMVLHRLCGHVLACKDNLGKLSLGISLDRT